VYAKFRCAVLRIKKALGIFRELITTTRTTRLAFGARLPGPKNLGLAADKLRHGLSPVEAYIYSLFDVSGALVAVLVGVAIGMLIGSLMLFAIVLIKNR